MSETCDFDELQDKFQHYCNFIKTKTEEVSQENLLTLYGLYKQSTQGNCNDPQPWKSMEPYYSQWHSWRNYYGNDRTTAMKKYVEFVQQLFSSSNTLESK